VAALVLVAVTLFVNFAAAKSSVDKESFYRGQIVTAMEISVAATEDFAALTDTYDGSTEWILKANGIVATWNYLNDEVKTFDAPKSMKDVQPHIQSAFEHQANAGNLIMQGVLSGDASLVEQGAAELQLAKDDMAKANDELKKVNGS
jgi:hypothetical protein